VAQRAPAIIKRGDKCSCPDLECQNLTAEPKWKLCRPCAIGNHFGGVCGDFRQTQWMPDLCIVCGYDLRDH